MLAPSSTWLILRECRVPPAKLRCLGAVDVGEASLGSVAKACVFATESCVVALERSCGLEGAVECAVEGRVSRPSPGRGGSGGGVSCCEAKELVDALRERFRIMLSVGFAKSVDDSTRSPLVEALLLFCVGAVGELSRSEAGVWGSAFPVSSIKMVVGRHLDSRKKNPCLLRHVASMEMRMRPPCIVTLIQVMHRAWARCE